MVCYTVCTTRYAFDQWDKNLRKYLKEREYERTIVCSVPVSSIGEELDGTLPANSWWEPG